MSELSVALAALGAFVLAGVVVHGAWQARQAGPKRAVEPLEPVMSPQDDAAEEVAPVPAALDAPEEPPAPAAEPPARKRTPRLDALIDALAPIGVEAPIAGETLIAHLPTTRRAGSKPFWIEGLNVATGEWEPPVAGAQYRELQAGVQLANRLGALNEIEYSEFVQKVQAFAESIGGLVDFPDMIDVAARARELDQFASQHDAQLAVQLRAVGAAWSVGYVEQHAARLGFVAGSIPGRVVLPGTEEGAPPVLAVAFDPQAALADDPNLSSIRKFTLAFDVPQTPADEEPFERWRRIAHQLADAMEGAVVDDRGHPLGDAGFDAIGRDLKKLYRALDARDLAAGSAAARRVFS